MQSFWTVSCTILSDLNLREPFRINPSGKHNSTSVFWRIRPRNVFNRALLSLCLWKIKNKYSLFLPFLGLCLFEVIWAASDSREFPSSFTISTLDLGFYDTDVVTALYTTACHKTMLKFLTSKFRNQSLNEVKPYDPQVRMISLGTFQKTTWDHNNGSVATQAIGSEIWGWIFLVFYFTGDFTRWMWPGGYREQRRRRWRT